MQRLSDFARPLTDLPHGATALAPAGLPPEVYCFSADVAGAACENLAADIFDHLLAMLPEFDLRIYQQPAGADAAMTIRALAARGAAGDGLASKASAARG